MPAPNAASGEAVVKGRAYKRNERQNADADNPAHMAGQAGTKGYERVTGSAPGSSKPGGGRAK
jgi:hypothetical protein